MVAYYLVTVLAILLVSQQMQGQVPWLDIIKWEVVGSVSHKIYTNFRILIAQGQATDAAFSFDSSKPTDCEDGRVADQSELVDVARFYQKHVYRLEVLDFDDELLLTGGMKHRR